MLNLTFATLARHHRWIRAGFFIATFAILILTLVPLRSTGDTRLPHADKIAHAVMFGGWSLMLGVALLTGSAARMANIGGHGQDGGAPAIAPSTALATAPAAGPAPDTVRIPLWMLFIAGSLFGAGVEMAQAIMPYGRASDPLDMAANAAGALLAVVVLRMLGHTSVEW